MAHDVDVDDGRLLLELTREVTSTLDLQEVLDKSLAALRRLIDFNGGSIQLIRDGALQMVAGDPRPPPEAFEFRLPIGEGFGGRVAATGEPVYSPDATVDPRAHPEGRKKASVAGTRSWFGAPLIVHGETIGVVQLDDLVVDHFPPPVQGRVLMFLPIVSAAVQNALVYGQEREAVTRLQETERLKREFVATVSHELRTPLTVVSGLANVLGTFGDAVDHDEMVTIGKRIGAAATRLDGLIGDLLEIAGIERGHLSVCLEPTAVEPLVRAAVAEADGGTHKLEVAYDVVLPLVLTDEGRVRQVLIKLLDNAQKFSAKGSPIRVAARDDGDGVAITIADEGCGIPPGMLDRVFEPFTQVDSSDSRAAGGLGTGLFLARRICDALDAALTVESELGAGTTVSLRLPRAAR